MFFLLKSITTTRLKSIVAQCIAITPPSLLLLGVGMALSFPTIAIPEMLYSTSDISLNDSQASFFGSVPFLMQPLGAMLSGPLVDYFGRKKAAFFVNIPHLLAWILMYFAPDLTCIFIANILLGFGFGFMEAPMYAYIAEVSEPSLRGTLSLISLSSYELGVLVTFFLGTILKWRQVALISLAVPVAAMLFTLVVPETPIWLLSQGRPKDALKSLQNLRGWTTEDNVKEEFDELVVYSDNLQRCVICKDNGEDNIKTEVTTDCEHTRMNPVKRFYLKFKLVMFCKETLRPLIFMFMYFLFLEMSGLTPIRPNMVNLCGAFGMAENAKNITFIVGVISFITSILVTVFIKLTGKRKLGIIAMLGCGLNCMALSIYAKMYIPDTVFSYDPKTFPQETSYWPLMFFYALAVICGCNVAWVVLGEVFPFRCRATAQGLATALDCVITFIAAKTLINFELNFHLWGTFAIYAGVGLAGTVFLYFFLPETEGVSLAEIEGYYKGEFRTFADDPIINVFRKCRCKKTT